MGKKLFILNGIKLGGVKEALVRQAAAVHGLETNRWRQAECEGTHLSLRSVWWRYKHSGRISRQEQVHLKNKINKKDQTVGYTAVTLTLGRIADAPNVNAKLSGEDI